MREFESGANRNHDEDKLDYEGFEHPLVQLRFAEYMHKHRKQDDGKIRDSDNWQKGIPREAYMKSLKRHVHDVWLHHRGCGDKATEDLETALCGVMFNAQGYLFEELK